MKKVKPGDPFLPRAEDFNRFIDAVQKTDAAFIQGAEPRFTNYRFTNIIRIKNLMEIDIPRFGIVELRQPAIYPWNLPPQSPEEQFFKYMIFDAYFPTTRYGGNFAVSLSHLKKGMVGYATVSGITPVKIWHHLWPWECADILPGNMEHLQTVPKGPFRILWIGSPEGAPRVVWAVVRFDTIDRLEFVRIWSQEKNDYGYYDGHVIRWISGNWSYVEQCYVVDANEPGT